jgi:hypothetical protein
VKKIGIIFAVILGVVLYLHRSLVHEIFVDTAIGLASMAGLSLAVAGVVHLAGRGREVQPARQRAVTQPAAIERPRVSRPGDPCAEACGRPATRMFDKWPVCDDCGGRLDAAAAHAAGRKPVTVPAEDDLPALTQPPVIPDGETIGGIDMTDFENRGTL